MTDDFNMKSILYLLDFMRQINNFHSRDFIILKKLNFFEGKIILHPNNHLFIKVNISYDWVILKFERMT